jgi:hypothetical protein
MLTTTVTSYEINPRKKMSNLSKDAYFLNDHPCPHMADTAVTWDPFLHSPYSLKLSFICYFQLAVS